MTQSEAFGRLENTSVFIGTVKTLASIFVTIVYLVAAAINGMDESVDC